MSSHSSDEHSKCSGNVVVLLQTHIDNNACVFLCQRKNKIKLKRSVTEFTQSKLAMNGACSAEFALVLFTLAHTMARHDI